MTATQETTAIDLIREKLTQAPAVLEEVGVDCWITFVRESLECPDPVLPLIFPYSLTWQSALLVTRTGERIAVIAGHDAEAVESIGTWDRIEGYLDGVREPLQRVISELNPKTIALNYSTDDYMADGLSHGMYQRLREYLPDHADRFVSAEPIVRAVRGRKSPAEIERIRAAITTTRQIFENTAAFVRVGTSEVAIADFMRAQARDRGCGLAWDPAMCPIVTSGPDSMLGHAVPSETVTVQPGRILNLDFGLRQNGYCSDLQRAWYVPEKGETRPPAEVQRAFDTVQHAIDAAIRTIRPGVPGWQVDAAARKTITDAGYPEFDHGTGHQVGRCAHDGGGSLAPKWERYGTSAEIPLEVGNVFTVEPSIADVAGRGYHAIEEIIVVTEDGCEFLSPRQQQLWMLDGAV